MTLFLQKLGKLNALMVFAAVITWSLFYIMQLLISSEFSQPDAGNAFLIGDVTMPELDFEVIKETPLPEKPVELEIPPPLDRISFSTDIKTVGISYEAPPPTIIGGDAGPVGPMDGDALPLVQIQPVYPSRALSRAIEGYVVLEFDVDESGLVINPRVLYAEPAGYFERASLKALERWRYKPKVINGREVKMFNVQQRMSFNMEK